MIAVTRLDGSTVFVNVDLIERFESTPDTVVSLVNGQKLLVREAPQLLIERVVQFKRAVHAGLAAAGIQPGELDEGAA